jgi:hypothetical protein
MQGDEKARFTQLCEQAAVERDGTRLLDLVREINDLLEKKRLRLDASKIPEDKSEGCAAS